MIQEVVARRDAREHLADVRSGLAFVVRAFGARPNRLS